MRGKRSSRAAFFSPLATRDPPSRLGGRGGERKKQTKSNVVSLVFPPPPLAPPPPCLSDPVSPLNAALAISRWMIMMIIYLWRNFPLLCSGGRSHDVLLPSPTVPTRRAPLPAAGGGLQLFVFVVTSPLPNQETGAAPSKLWQPRSWRFMLLRTLKALPQPPCGHLKGFSPVWECEWMRRLLGREKALLHVGQT